MAKPDRFTEGFSGLMAGNVTLFLWKSGDLKIPKFLSDFVYALLLIIIFFSIYWMVDGLRDRYANGPLRSE